MDIQPTPEVNIASDESDNTASQDNRPYEFLPVQLVRVDGGTQMRAGLNEGAINDYTNMIKEAVAEAEAKCPVGGNLIDHFVPPLDPIEVIYDGSDYWPWDGFHRRASYVAANLPVVPAHVTPGTRDDAIRKAAGANNRHGVRMTAADKRRAVVALLTHERWGKELSNRQIARECGVSPGLVNIVAKELEHQSPSPFKRKDAELTEEEMIAEIRADAPDLAQMLDAGKCELDEAWSGLLVRRRVERDNEKARRKQADDPQPYAKQTRQRKTKEASTAPEPADPEDDLTDEEWLETLPLYRALRRKTHRGMLLSRDALAWRTFHQNHVLSSLSYFVSRNIDTKSGGDTPFPYIMMQAAHIPHPKEWKKCACNGDGCDQCGYSGYQIYTGNEVIE